MEGVETMPEEMKKIMELLNQMYERMNEESLKYTMGISEAAELYGVDQSTINKALHNRFIPEKECRRSGRNWLVTRAGMERVFGEKDDGGEPSKLER